jgi:hypothetical protein
LVGSREIDMGIDAGMLLTYLQAKKADDVTRQTQDIANKSTAQGDQQVAWANDQSNYLVDQTKTAANDQFGLGKKLVEQGDQATQWGNEQADISTAAGQDVYNTQRAAATENRARGTQQWKAYLNTYAPIEIMSAIDSVGGIYADDATFNSLADQYASSIPDPAQRESTIKSLQSMRTASKSGSEQAAGQAAGEVGKGYAAREAEMNRTLGARGVSAEKLAGLSRMSDVQRAADIANSANTARTENLNAGVANRYNQIGIGRKVLETGIGYDNAATNSDNAAISNLNSSQNTAANLRQSGLNFYNAGSNATSAGESTLTSGLNQASDMRNESNSWYNTSLNALNTQSNANQSVTNAGFNALSNNRQQSQMEKQNSAANAAGLGQLAGTAISAGAYFFK